jgi:prepilin-type N-terminal cleavage/methylation domain-containing protein
VAAHDDRDERKVSRAHAAVVALCARLPGIDEQQVRNARRATNQILASGGLGFTLIELLVVIVILGTLGGVAAVAVGKLHDGARSSACAATRSTVEAALESYRALYGTYTTEAGLVNAGILRSETSTYDIDLVGDSYALVATGDCADDVASDPSSDSGGTGAVTTTGSSTTVAPTTTATTTTPAVTTTTTPAVTTTTTPAVTTTTEPAALTLSSVCTPSSHWPDDRAWEIHNPNDGTVAFTLTATNASSGWNNPVSGAAPSGSSTWYLPKARRGSNAARLEDAGHLDTANSTNRRC